MRCECNGGSTNNGGAVTAAPWDDKNFSAVTADSPPVLDRARLAALIKMAGPEVAPELLGTLRADLDLVARHFAATLDRRGPPDWADLRAQSHVLIALAGSTGAPRLHQRARDLNTLAHAEETDRATALIRECLDLLSLFDAELVTIQKKGSAA